MTVCSPHEARAKKIVIEADYTAPRGRERPGTSWHREFPGRRKHDSE